ncbi:hypothetical protein ACFPM0_33085 [Pseudonocardia sulfidoxydans]
MSTSRDGRAMECAGTVDAERSRAIWCDGVDGDRAHRLCDGLDAS